MTPLQKYCANCGKRAKNTGGWRYSPIFCNDQCEKAYHEKHLQRLKIDPKYAAETKKWSIISAIYLLLFGALPILVLIYGIFFL